MPPRLRRRKGAGSVLPMHPIERLRYVARGGELELGELVQDAAFALAGFADDPSALVTACRSLVDRHPAAGPVWWLAARVLSAVDPADEAWRVLEEAESDRTPSALYREVPEGACVLVVGWPASVAAGLSRRGDCRLLVVDAAPGFRPERVGRASLEVEQVPESGLGAAAGSADLVLVEAQAMGPAEREAGGPCGAAGLVAASGARAAAAVAAAAGTPVWAVAPAGRVLPAGLWQVLAGRLAAAPQPWHEPDELVPLGLVSAVVRPSGVLSPADAVGDPDCPFAPELVRPLDAPGSHR